ncbi:alpha/beta fold hydrolase [Streptomyces sp. NPDC015131]|uniref:alpha/beta fold hydrolase n=1 Tax=Streptomyces sp. NPDC015131 TaxID=3364941 RepID=UPI003701909B
MSYARVRAGAGAAVTDGGAPTAAPTVTVAYERCGAGEPLVLLHGLGDDRRVWDGVVPLLPGRETIALDLPGFGDSPPLDPAVPWDLDTAVAWLGVLFAGLRVERPHVAGHSLGGLIALCLGRAGLARTVTALAPAGFWTAAERRYAYAVLALSRQGAGARAALRAGRAPGPAGGGDVPGVPVTVAWGSRDPLLPPWQAKRAGAAIPGARLVALPRCGHVPMVDDPALVARVLREATGSPPGGVPRG